VARAAAGVLSYLSGGFHTYGHNDVWRKTDDWENALVSKGAQQMKILRDFFASLAWWKLVPKPEMIRTVFMAGHVAACSEDGDFAAIYYAHRSTLSVDFGLMAKGRRVVTEWMDPQTGERFGRTVHANAEPVRRITSPAQCDDAILLLQAE